MAKRKLTRGQRNCDWIEHWCRIPEGKDVGKPVKLRPWQKKEICRIYDNKNGTRRAILSFGRKNAKSTLAAFLLLLHLCGPEARRNSQLFSAAQSRDQASLIFSLAAKVVRMNPDLSKFIIIRDNAKQLFCRDLGTLYRALSADASTAYGLSPVFIVHDELGQVKGPRSELYEALETATGAQQNPLSIIISTQAPTNNDLLSILIDDALAGHDPRVTVSLYTAPEDDDPFEETTIKKANPAFGDFLNRDEVLAMANDAMRMPTRENEFRNLILNQRVEAESPFISRGVWESCGNPVVDNFDNLPVYIGLDLSSVSDLTAMVALARIDNVWHVKPTFWLPEVGLAEKARADRVPYDLWHKQDFLNTTPGSAIEYEWIALRLRVLFDIWRVEKCAFDRWNFRHLCPWLQKAGFSDEELEEKFVEFGQGYQSMSPALRDLEAAILEKKIAHGNHPVLSMCAANAVVQVDPAGNRKLTKAKSNGRIDGLVALAMAYSVAHTSMAEPEPTYQMFFVG